MLLGHLQGLASTLGNMLAVTFLLQVSQQCLRPPLGLLTASDPGAPGTAVTLIDLLPLAFPTDPGTLGPAVPANGTGGARRSHRWGGRGPGLSLSCWAERHAENSMATGRGGPQAST